MPKIELPRAMLIRAIGREVDDAELEILLETAKAEIDEPADAAGRMKIELNDTNRPDLWSTAGLGRHLRTYLGSPLPVYPFLSRPGAMLDAGARRVTVDPALREVRPYIAAFAVTGRKIDEPALEDLIQSQEKLCTNFGRRRSSIAMGVYRTALMEFPVRYLAADPESTAFVPLGMEESLSLTRILELHPKGQEYGWIVAGMSRMPFLTDSRREVLSFPPIINSARVGAVEVGDEELFVELTGTELESLLLACSIVACDLADAGHTVLPVAVEYPYDTPYGRTVVTPFWFQAPVATPFSTVNRLLGEEIDPESAVSALRAMGLRAEAGVDDLAVETPAYRNDFLHPVDVVEEVIIGRGMRSFRPEMPSDFTIGRLTEAERFGRQVIGVMVGMGFLELIFPCLGSGRDFLERMYPASARSSDRLAAVKLANPMSESYEYLRNSIIPFLLGAESVSAHAAYPHLVFEVGKIARLDAEDNHGVRTIDALGFLIADADAGFTRIAASVSVLFYYLSREYELVEAHDARFIEGRSAQVVLDGRPVGVFGELHPEVLDNFGVTVPAAACELDLDLVRAVRSWRG